MQTSHDILDAVGHTPLIELRRVIESASGQVFAKAEFLNPGGSVKDRIAKAMIESAEEAGVLKPGMTVIEPTSGNTGIGLALVCAVKGYTCVLTMPDTMSLERIYTLQAYGVEVVLTPGAKGMTGAIERALMLAKERADVFIPHQFENSANPDVHAKTTAREIIEQTDGRITAFVAGVGTGGTISGVGRALKAYDPKIKVIAVEPAGSPVLSGGKAGQHKIQGIGAGFAPKNFDASVVDEIVTVSDEDAYAYAKRLAREEGLFCGISSGAAAAASVRVAANLGRESRVVTVFADTGSRYFSAAQYFEF